MLGYGVVDQLLRLGGASGSTVLATHNGERPGPPALVEGHFKVGAQILALLGALQDEGPVLLVVDDAHWADAASLKALLFALRRLVADRVLTLIVVRDEDAPQLPEGLRRIADGDTGATVHLGPLDAADLRELAEAMGLERFSTRAAQRLRAHTAGNPLYAWALLEELPAQAWEEGGRVLPAPRSFAAVVERRLEACRPEARRLVEAAAVLGLRCTPGRGGRPGRPARPAPGTRAGGRRRPAPAA
jgi:predicted ATPase